MASDHNFMTKNRYHTLPAEQRSHSKGEQNPSKTNYRKNKKNIRETKHKTTDTEGTAKGKKKKKKNLLGSTGTQIMA